MQHTCRKAPYPSPSSDSWNKAAIWPANNPGKNVSYDQLAKSNRKHFKDCNIIIPKNLHAYRTAAARDMDDQGMADTVNMTCLTPQTLASAMSIDYA